MTIKAYTTDRTGTVHLLDGALLAAPFEVDFTPNSDRWGWEYFSGAGTATMVLEEIIPTQHGTFVAVALGYPEDVNSEVPITLPDIAAPNVMYRKVFDRLVAPTIPTPPLTVAATPSGPSGGTLHQPRRLRLTVTPTGLQLVVFNFFTIRYGK